GEETEREGAGDAEFLVEPARRRRDGALARPRVAAAGIRPQSAGVVFARVPLLQHDAPVTIDKEDRERAVQEAGAMDGLLAARADRTVALVDQDQRFVAHRFSEIAGLG